MTIFFAFAYINSLKCFAGVQHTANYPPSHKLPRRNKDTDKTATILRFVGVRNSVINHACPIISSITLRILSIVASVAMIGGFISIAGRQFAL